MARSVKERLIQFLEAQHISKAEFGRTIGVSNAYVTSMRKSIDNDKLKRISTEFPELNIIWLLTGEGGMLNSNQTAIKDYSTATGVPTVKERIKEFIRYKGISTRSFESTCGFSYGYVGNMRQSIQPDKVKKIAHYFPDLNTGWLLTGEGSMLKDPSTATQTEKQLIPLYADVTSIGVNDGSSANVSTPHGSVLKWIDAGDWFPGATAAIHHYGDSMVEYPSGCILALKRVEDTHLIINGKAYVIETDEFCITKQLQYDGGDYLMAYSSNNAKYDDGRLIHAPIRIPIDAVRHIDLVIGYVVFSTA